jgi:protein SCO1/2
MATDRFSIWAAGILLAAALSAPPPAAADAGAPPGDAEAALALSQSAIGRTVGDFAFRDSEGRAVSLADYRGRPLVVSFVYSSCYHTCPVITTTLADAVEVARDALGDDSFAVVSVGFDVAEDTPQRMRAFARQQGVGRRGWSFLSGEAPQVAGLADALGFTFYRSSKGFDHLAQVTVIDGEGVVRRQVYGETFATPHLVQPLKQLVLGTPTPLASLDDLIKAVRLYCTIYDPAADRYRFDYSLFVQIGVGAVIVIFLSVVVVRGWWRTRRPGAGGTSA